MKRCARIVVAGAFMGTLLLSACSGGRMAPGTPGAGFLPSGARASAPAPVFRVVPASGDVEALDYGVLPPDSIGPRGAAVITLTPSTLALLGTGTVSATAVEVSETGYTGGFTEKSTCAKVADAAPTTLQKAGKVTVTGKAAGACAITFTDRNKHVASLKISDTTASIALSADSISAGSKSVVVVLKAVGGKAPAKGLTTTVKVNLTACSKGCSVAGPQAPPGSDTFAVEIKDGKLGAGKTLATGSVVAAVKAAKANSIVAKVPKTIAALAIAAPSGAAGTAFTKKAVALTVKDADGNAITSGTYAVAVKVTDSDTSGATTLQVNGAGAKGSSVTLDGATDKPTLNYSGLAIAPTKLTPRSTGAKATAGSFAPALAAIKGSITPTPTTPDEIDLYATSGTGSSATLALTQAGWTGSYAKKFTYTVKSGASNNCSSYTIAPSVAATTFTVTAKASAVAGTCATMTVTGGGGKTLAIVLTYTTSSIGINGRHR